MQAKGEKDKGGNGQPNKISYEHLEVLNIVIKAIQDVPMDNALKNVMILRIWGTNKNNHRPMSHEEIAIMWASEGKIGTHDVEYAVQQIKQMESEGKACVKEHLKHHSPEDIVGRFNESERNKYKIFDPTKKRIIP